MCKIGIFPYSSTIVAREKLFPSENLREDRQVEKVKAINLGKEAVENFLQMKSKKSNTKKVRIMKSISVRSRSFV